MALDVTIIDVDGNARTVKLEPDKPLVISPGETVVLTPEAAIAMDAARVGEDLALEADGEQLRISGFFAPVPEGAPASAVGYLDEAGFHLLTPTSSFDALSFTAISDEFYVRAEQQPLPESFAGADNAERAVALRSALPSVFEVNNNPDGDGDDDDLSLIDELAIGTTVGIASNQDPVLDTGQSFSVSEAAPAGSPIGLVVASDPDGDALTFSITGGNQAGIFAINAATGALTIADPSTLDFETLNQFALTVRVSDGKGGKDTETVRINVSDANDAPQFTSPTTFAIAENSMVGAAVGTLTATDLDSPVGNLRFSIVGGTGASAFNVNAVTGAISVANNTLLDREARAELTLQVRVDDNGAPNQSTVQNVTVQIGGVNEFSPVITSANAFAVAENTTAVGIVTASDADLPGDVLNFSTVGGADQGRFTIDPNSGVLSFNFNPDFEMPIDSGGDNVYDVMVQVTDGVNTSATQNIAVTVSDGNDAPVAVDDAGIAVNEDATTANIAQTILRANDSDPDVGDTFTITAVNTTGTIGTVSFTPGAAGAEIVTYAADAAAQDALAAGETMMTTFTYTITDTAGGLTDTATATVTVTGINDAPTSNTGTGALGNADSSNVVSTPVATAVATLLANSGHADVDNSALSGVAVTALTTPGSWEYSLDSSNGVDGTWSAMGAVAANSARVLASTAWVRFTPPNDGSTATETVTYRGWDQSDAVASGTAAIDTTTNGGTTAFTVNTFDSTHAISPVNDPPDAVDDPGIAANEDAVTADLVAAVLGNDSDPDQGDSFGITAVDTTGTVGTVAFSAGGAGFGDETLTYAADDPAQDALAAGETMMTTFTYTIADVSEGLTDTATATVTVTGVNDAPTSLSGSAALGVADSSNVAPVPVATSVATLLTNAGIADVDNAALSGVAVTATATPANWEFSLDSTNGVNGTWSAMGAVASNSARVLAGSAWVRFTPPSDGSVGSESLSYRAWDQSDALANGSGGIDTTTNGGTSAFSVNTFSGAHAVLPINDPPDAVDDPGVAVNEDASTGNIAQTILRANDSDPDAGDSFTITAVNTTGTIGTVVFAPGAAGAEVISYTADAASQDALAAGETMMTTFTYTVADSAEGLQDTATVTVTVTGVNDAPTSNTGSAALGGADSSDVAPVPVATSVAALLTNSSNADIDNSALSGIAVTATTTAGGWEYSLDSTNGVNGTWSALGAVAANSARVLANTAWVRFTPPNDGSTATETFSYRSWDQSDAMASGTGAVDTTTNGGESAFSVNTFNGTHAVAPVNDPPNAVDDPGVTVNEDATTANIAQTILRANDSDPDVGDTFTITGVNTTGTVGTVSFTPGAAGAEVVTYSANAASQDALAAGETMMTTFTYTITDAGGGLQDSATVTVTVTGVNDAPTSNVGSAALGSADSSNVTPVPVATSVAALVTNSGSADIDNGALSGIAVTATTTTAGWQYSLDSTNGVDGTWSAMGAVAANSARVLADTAWVRFSPPSDGSTATETISYRGWDRSDATANGTGGVDTTTNGSETAFSINTFDGTHTVAPVNDPPDAIDDPGVTVNEDATTADLVATVLGNDTDPDQGDSFGIIGVNTTGTIGTVSFNAGGIGFGDETLTYSAIAASQDALAAGETMMTTFAYTIADVSEGLQDTATVTVTVTGVNDAPTSNAGSTALGGADSSNVVSTPVATAVAALLTNSGNADIDNGALSGIAVTATTTTAGWEYSLDSSNGVDGTWSAMGAVAANSARVLANTAWVRFTPPNDGSTATETLSYRSWDRSDATANGTGSIDTTTNGGETAFGVNTFNGTHAVAPVNDPPNAVDDPGVTVNEDATTANIAQTILRANDSDPDVGDTFTITGVNTTGTVGTVSFTPGAAGAEVVTYSANAASQDVLAAGETMMTTFTYTITDTFGGLQDTATATVTVTGVNDAPTSNTGSTALAGADSSNVVSTPVATAVAALLTNSGNADIDNSALSGIAVTATTTAGGWEFSLNSTNGVDGTWSAMGAVAANSARVLANTAWVRFTPPNDGSTATETFSYRSWDQSDAMASGTGAVDTTTNGGESAFSVNTFNGTHAVAPVNDPPNAVDDPGVTVNEDATTANIAQTILRANDSDPDVGDTFTITGVNTTGTIGTVSFTPGAAGAEVVTYSANAASQDALAAGETMMTTFTYTITDTFGGLQDTATATVTVTGVNDAPTSNAGSTALAGADSSNVAPVPVATSVAALLTNSGNADIDNSALSGIAVTATTTAGGWEYSLDSTNGVNGTWSALGAVAANSARVLANTAWVRFTPPNDGSTATETFSYRSWDQSDAVANGTGAVDTTTNGGETAFGVNTFNGTHAVAPVNDPPNAVDDPGVTVNEDATTANIAQTILRANDSDPDVGDTFTITGVNTTGTVGTVSFTPGAAGAEVVTYSANAASQDALAAGETMMTTFTYTITDAGGGLTDTATATVTVTGVNDAPTSNVGSAALAGADSSNVVSTPVATAVAALLTNSGNADIDNGALSGIAVTATTTTAGWEFSLDSTNGVDGTWSAMGAVAANSARVLADTAWVRFTPPNDGSTATETFSYRSWDRSDATANGTGSIDTTTNGGETAFGVNTFDGTHAVAPVNDPPNAVDDPGVAVNEDASTGNIAQTILRANDSDPDVGDTFTITGVNTTGTVGTVSFTPGAAGAEVVTYSANAASQDALAAGETMMTTFTYTITDAGGGLTDTATATVTVTGVNDAPTSNVGSTALAGADSSNVAPVPVATSVVALLTNSGNADIDNGALSGIAVTATTTAGGWEYSLDSTNGVNGTWSAMGAVTANSARVLANTAWVRFTPPADGSTTTETFSYRGWDQSDAIANGTATVDSTTNGGETAFSTNVFSGTHAVAPVNDPPNAVDDPGVAVNEDATTANLVGTLLANDSDPDQGDSFGIIGVNTAGTVGTVTFNAGAAGFGDETLTYTASAASQDTLAAGATMMTTFTYTIADVSEGLQDTATVTVTVTGVNDAPTSNSGSTALGGADSSNVVSTPVATSVAALLTNSSNADVDNGALAGIVVTATTTPGGWEYSLDSTNGVNGTWSAMGAVAANSARVLTNTAWVRFTPPTDGSTATETFSYRSWDRSDATANGTGGIDTTTNGGETAFSVNTFDGTYAVAPVNDPPNAVDDPGVAVNEDAATADLVATLLGNDSDPDQGDVIGIIGVNTTGTVGAVTFNPGGAGFGDETLVYTANAASQDALAAGETMMTTFTYTIADTNEGLQDTATVTVTVTGVNDAPTSNVGSAGLGAADSSNVTPSPIATSVATLLTNAGIADADNGSLSGIAVTATTTTAGWEYSLDSTNGVDGTWQAMGAVAANSARVLTDAAWVRFTPPNDGSTATETFSYRGWDRTDASANGASGVDTTANGGQTAFSANVFDATHAVAPVNDPPNAVDDPGIAVNEDAVTADLVATLLANDTDPDQGDTLGIVSVNTTGTVGTVSFNAGAAGFGDETLTYSANAAAQDALAAGETMMTTFTYTIADTNEGLQDTATVTVTVTGVNDAPTSNAGSSALAAADSSNVAPTPVATSVASLLTASGNADADNGALSGIAVTATTTAGNWEYSLDSTTGVDGTWSAMGAVAANSARVLTNTAWVRFTPPNDGSTSTETFSFRGWDRTDASANGTGSIDTTTNGGETAFSTNIFNATHAVAPVNDPPNAVNDPGVAVNEDAVTADLVATLLANDSDPDQGDSFGIISVNTTGTVGTVAFNAGGVGFGDETLTYSANAASQDALAAGETMMTTFTYTIADAAAGLTDTATVTVTVIGVNDAPTSNAGSTALGTADSSNAAPVPVATSVAALLTNSGNADIDNGALSGIAVTATTTAGGWEYSLDSSNGVNGTWSAMGAVTANSARVLANTAWVRFTPPADGSTATETFSYRGWDRSDATANGTGSIDTTTNGGESAFSTNVFNGTHAVAPVNDPPNAVDDPGVAVNEDAGTGNIAQTILRANDSDPDVGDTFTITGVNTTGTVGAVGFTPGVAGTEVVVYLANAASQDALAAGETMMTTFAYTITDAGGGLQDTATVTVTVTGVNDAPTSNTGSTALGGADSSNGSPVPLATSVAALLTNSGNADIDNGALSGIAVTATTTPAGWEYSLDSSNGVDGTWSAMGAVTANSARVLANTAWVRFTPPNDGSTATETFSYRGWDQSDAVANGTGAVNTTANGGETAFSTNVFSGTHAVAPANDPPDAVDDPGVTVNEDATTANIAQTILRANDSDPDVGDTFTITGVNTTGTVGTVSFTPGAAGAEVVTYSANAASQDALAAGETMMTTFTYTITDTFGGLQDTATVTVTVTGVNDAPTSNTGSTALAGADSSNVAPVPVATSVAALLTNSGNADIDNGALSGIAVTTTTTTAGWQYSLDSTNGVDGTWSAMGAVAANSARVLANTAWVRFTPPNDGSSATETFSYRSWDRSDAIANGTGAVNTTANGGETAFSSNLFSGTHAVAPVNDPPNAVDDPGVTVNEDATTANIAQTILRANDSDPDAGDTFTITGVNTVGTVGTVSFTPGAAGAEVVTYSANAASQDALAAGETMMTTFTYTITDAGGGLTDTATATVTVTGVNDAPTSNAGSTALGGADSSNGSPVPVATSVAALLTNSGNADIDNGALSGIAVTATTTAGGWEYSLDSTNGVNGTWSAMGVVTAGSARVLANTAWVRFTPPNDGSSATETFSYRGWDQSDAIANGTGAVNTTANGGETAFSTNVFSGTHAVAPVNDPPDAVDDPGVAVNEDAGTGNIAQTILRANDSDPDVGDTFTITGVNTTGTVGAVGFTPGVAGTEVVTYSANAASQDALAAGETMMTTFTYTITDAGGGLTDTATVTVTVTGVNDAPTSNTGSTALGGADSSNGSPVPVATSVAALLTNSGSADIDNGALSGIAVTATTTAGGWEYSLDSTNGVNGTWLAMGAVTAGSARVLANTAWVRFTPPADGSTATETFSYRGWDRSDAIANGTGAVNTTANGGETAFSTNVFSGTHAVAPVNDPPNAVDDPGVAVNEDASTGNIAQTILRANDSDPDVGDTFTITGVNTTGTVGAVGFTPGVAGTEVVVYVANAASQDALAAGETMMTTFTYTITDAGGGLTDTATVTVTVTGVNDAPTSNAGSTALGGADSSNGSPVPVATSVAALLTNSGNADIDNGALSGIAVTATTTAGGWEYSLDSTNGVNGTWLAMGAVAANSARVLANTAWVRFTAPADGSTATETFSYRGWDQSDAIANGTATVDTTTNGGETAFSTNVFSGTHAVAPVNDPPNAVDDPGVTVNEDAATGNIAQTILRANDSDPDVGDTFTITGVNPTGTVGTVSFTPGAAGAEVVTYSANAASQDALAAGETMMTTFTYTITDTFGGLQDTATVTVTVTGVNDAPTTNAGTAALAAADSNDAVATAVATSVAALLTNSGHADADNAAQSGIAVTATTTTGSWEFSLNSTNGVNGTWSAMGAVAANSARVLADTAWVRFTPPTDGSSATETFSYRGWDQSGVLANGAAGVDTTTNGGTTAFSVNTFDGTHAVSPINDAPTNSGGALPSDFAVAQAVAEAFDISTLNLQDPDSAGSVTMTLSTGAGNGTLAASSGGGVTVGGSGTATLTLMGTLAALNTFIDNAAAIQYTSSGAASGDNADTITVTVNDNQGSGNVGMGVVNVDVAGGNPPIGSIDLMTLDGSLGYRINGEAAGGFIGDNFGRRVTGVGDLNGDGLDDIGFGAPEADPGSATNEGDNFGAVYVKFGELDHSALTGVSTVGFDAGLINGSNGIIIEGNTATTGLRTGSYIGGGGDVDGDGFDDLLVGSNFTQGIGQPDGYIFAGDSDVSASNRILSSAINGTQGADLDGNAAGTNLGYSLTVSNAGDVNGDGRDDLLVGEYNDSDGDSNEQGVAYLVFGDTMPNVHALGDLNANAGVLKLTSATNQDLGAAVASAGDINGDGYDDFVIGGPEFGGNLGRAYVVFGGPGLSGGTLDLDTLNGATTGFSVSVNFLIPLEAGRSVSSAGDFNGDGIDDLLIGAPDPTDLVGGAFVLYGTTTGFASSYDLDDLDGTNGGFRIYSKVGASDFGSSVAAAGDVNGDGFDDIIVGDPKKGEAYLIFGNTDAVILSRHETDPDPGAALGDYWYVEPSRFDGTRGVILDGLAAAEAGASVDGAGDVNGDGFDDVVIGAPFAGNATADPGLSGGTNSPGQGYLVFGRDFAGGDLSAPAATISSAVRATATGSEAIVGTSGADTLSSATFANVVLNGGAGDDILRINGNEFRVDGGNGLDTLFINADGVALDFTQLIGGARDSRYSDIESIDMTGSNGASVTLELRDLLQMTGNGLEINDNHGLRIIGDANDSLTATVGQGGGTWSVVGTNVTFADTGATEFTEYAVSGFASPASLFVDESIGTVSVI